MPKKRASRILLVEGKNDLHVMSNLCQYHDLPKTFEIYDREGVDNVLEAFEAELASPDRECIGIIVDADADLSARWNAVLSILDRRGYIDLPDVPNPSGTIISQNNKPTTGVWLMPNNNIPGELEDFIAFLIPGGNSNPLWNYAAQCLNGLPSVPERYPEQDRSKAHVHSWLAWQKEPGKPLGQAITARYIDANAAEANKLITWLRQLFVDALSVASA